MFVPPTSRGFDTPAGELNADALSERLPRFAAQAAGPRKIANVRWEKR
jgi:hypothetical protein